jgi:hypothetical protein
MLNNGIIVGEGYSHPQGAIKFGDYYYICLAEGSTPLIRTKNFQDFVPLKSGIYTNNIRSITTCNDYLVISSDMGIYRSNDDGEYWEALPNEYSAKSTILSSNGKQLFVKYNSEIAMSTDCGETWEKIYDEETGELVSSIGFSTNGDVFLGGTSSGLSQKPITNLISSINRQKSTDDSDLIYPNPTNDFIKIKDYSGTVKITNTLGIVVWEGNINLDEKINISNLPSGIYIINYGTESRKFVKQ